MSIITNPSEIIEAIRDGEPSDPQHFIDVVETAIDSQQRAAIAETAATNAEESARIAKEAAEEVIDVGGTPLRNEAGTLLVAAQIGVDFPSNTQLNTKLTKPTGETISTVIRGDGGLQTYTGTVLAGSTSLVTSGGVYNELLNKANTNLSNATIEILYNTVALWCFKIGNVYIQGGTTTIAGITNAIASGSTNFYHTYSEPPRVLGVFHRTTTAAVVSSGLQVEPTASTITVNVVRTNTTTTVINWSVMGV